MNSTSKRRTVPARDDEEEDLTKDMEDPTPEPNIQEVNIPKPSMSSMILVVMKTLYCTTDTIPRQSLKGTMC